MKKNNRSAAASSIKPLPSFSPLHRISLVDQTGDAIKQLITGHKWSGVLPGEEALRKELGVSRVTLRQSLSRLAQQGWIKIGGRGYRHSITHKGNDRGLKQAGKLVRILSPVPENLQGQNTQRAIAEIRKKLESAGLRVEWECRPWMLRGNSNKRLAEISRDSQAACWGLFRVPRQVQKWFQEARIPCLVLGPCYPGISLPSVEADVVALGRHAASEARRLGHRHLAYVVDVPSVASAMATVEGLRHFLTKDGQPAELTIVKDPLSVDGLRQALLPVLTGSNPATFLVLTEAEQVMPSLGILREFGLRVPEEVSVVVRDDEPILTRSIPEFARYSFDWERIGRAGGRMLIEIAESGGGKQGGWKLVPVFVRGQTLAHRRSS